MFPQETPGEDPGYEEDFYSDDIDSDRGVDIAVIGLAGRFPGAETIEAFWQNLLVPGSGRELNQSLERAGRVADFLEFAELMVRDALAREESCGCHLREESQTGEHEAKRDDEHFSHVAVWEYTGDNAEPLRHQEQLHFEDVTPSRRSYK